VCGEGGCCDNCGFWEEIGMVLGTMVEKEIFLFLLSLVCWDVVDCRELPYLVRVRLEDELW